MSLFTDQKWGVPITATRMYNGKVILKFDPARHLYTVNDIPADGCTSVLGVINKPALLNWGVKMAAEYVDANLPLGVPIDEIQKKKLIDGCKAAHRIKKTDAGDLGTMLHALIEKFVKKLPYDEPVNAVLKNSFEQFKAWVAANKVIFKCSERVVYSRKLNVAGTLDMIASVNGKIVLCDLKTGNAIYSEMFLQTSFYKFALQEEFPKKKIDHVAIIRCGKDGSFEVVEANDFEENIKAFMGAVVLHRRLKRMEFEKRKI